MAGKKAFVPELALDKAMNLFWERGYEGSSIEDLVQCTGVGRGSLYDTFGDKHALYLAALDRYCVLSVKSTPLLEQQTGTLVEVLEKLFQTYTELLVSDPARRGCFLVNANVEMAPHDPAVSQKVQSAYNGLEEVFYLLLIKAQAAGEFSWRHDPHQFASFLLGTLISIRVLARAKASRETLQGIVKTALLVFN
jgi:TetR/AcrR family transcriptional repressor of nem operon